MPPPYKKLAIIFFGKYDNDYTYTIYRNNDYEPWQLVEKIPEGFQAIFQNSASIYTLDDVTFQNICTGFHEVVSEVTFNTTNEEYLGNVYTVIPQLASDDKIQLYLYPNRPKEIPQDNSDFIVKQIN